MLLLRHDVASEFLLTGAFGLFWLSISGPATCLRRRGPVGVSWKHRA